MKTQDKIFERYQEIFKDYFDGNAQKEIKKIISRFTSEPSSPIKGKELIKINTPEKIRVLFDYIGSLGQKNLTQSKLVDLYFTLCKTAIAQGELSTAIDLCNHILVMTKDKNNFKNAHANALLIAGEVNSRQAEWAKSFSSIKKAKAEFLYQNDLIGLANCENLLGAVYGELGEIKKAEKHFLHAYNYLDEKRDKTTIAGIETNLGIINNIRGKLDLAFSFFKRSLLKYEIMGDFRRVAELRHNLGMNFSKRHIFNKAVKEFDRSINISLEYRYLPTLAISLLGKSYVCIEQREYDLASALANKGLEVSHQINDKLTIADIYKIYGIIRRKQKMLFEAENYFLSSLRINQDLNNKLNYAETSYELGLLYKDMKNEKEAKKNLTFAKNYFKSIDAVDEVVKISAYL